ncbi:hypothetical protein FACS189421_01300 [Bacteroidia bacterium]|nr:hypothetical protein FACS189421_01300 [Bacteroidia bacterium]GHT04573.1 hypothetical protein FACS189423_07460 [Bacteroidia bacterium]GHT46089.1 hypothetical protein FACS189440_03370 [Bacteroidia bacterium]
MNKINLLIISLWLCIGTATAQTYYYNTTKTFAMSGYSYKADAQESNGVILFNAASTLTYATQTYKDSSKLGWDYSRKGDTENDAAMRNLASSIVKDAFTTAEKQRINGKRLTVNMVINPETGKVLEVYFNFWKDELLATIYISTYRIIEKTLKNQLQFNITTKGKELNFVYRGLRIEIE